MISGIWLDRNLGFFELKIKESYDSVEDNIVDEFLIPVLKESSKYYRITGFFSSSALAVASRGIFPFIKNGGEMRILTSINFHERDLQAIKEGLKEPEKIIESTILEELENIEEGTVRDRIRLLSWMIAKNLLEIKIAIISAGYINDRYKSGSQGLFHQKVGIFFDEENSIISFSGSINETKSGWIHNIEEFKVFRSWANGEKKYLESDLNKFFRYWDNKVHKIKTYTIPEAAKKKMIDMAPKDLKELEKLCDSIANVEKEQKLWEHQEKAIDRFLNKKFGILEMATGTGKTYTALRISKHLLDNKEIDGIVIATKGNDLLDQWYKELINYFDSSKVIIYRHYEKYKQARNFLDLLKKKRNIVHISSYENLSFLINQDKNDNLDKCLLICDEIHNIGSSGNIKSLFGKLDVFSWRLGLSATPERPYDNEGNVFIENEIGEIIFRFDLEEAIKKGILCEFHYEPIKFNLSSKDKTDIRNLIGYFYATQETNQRMTKEELYQKLARIRKLSKAKLPKFKDYIEKNPKILNNCIIFVETRDYGLLVQKIILKYTVDYHTYYSQDNEINLQLFSKGKIKCLITCKKISEGIDIKSTRNIILFSSARSKLETIQRLGRSLRIDPKNPSKKACVVDFINEEDLEESNLGYVPADKYRFNWLSKLSKIKRD